MKGLKQGNENVGAKSTNKMSTRCLELCTGRRAFRTIGFLEGLHFKPQACRDSRRP